MARYSVSAVTATAIALFIFASDLRADASSPVPETPAQRHRLVVLTDIGADPDDVQSLVRLLLYANDIDIEGLVATSSTHLRNAVNPDRIRDGIAAYSEVLSSLRLHDTHYPDAGVLAAKVAAGTSAYGMAGVGEGKDTAGSDLLISALDSDDPRPLWVSVWGGANTLAQALWTLKETRSREELASLIARLRVYTISDQDDAGPWLRQSFPGLFYIVSPGDNYGMATWNAIMRVVDGIDNTTISNAWIAKNIQQAHGPLGAYYPDVVWGMEGDTPAFLSLIPNGLNAPEHPDWGGWGGRYERYVPEAATMLNGVDLGRETRPIWTNAEDAWTPTEAGEYGRAMRWSEPQHKDFLVTLWRWRDDFQNDFAARMDWTVKPVAEANHPPVVVLSQPTRLSLKSGQGVFVDAGDSVDPDGDSLSFNWFHYPEAGTYEGDLPRLPNQAANWITAPRVERKETLHIILRVSDKGSPPLARYARIVVTVEPQ